MAFDIHTLAAASFLSLLIQTLALFAQFRFDRRPAGSGWWALANAAICVGFVCNYARDLPVVGNLAIVLNAVFFLLGLALIRIGVSRFYGGRAPFVPMWIILSAATAIAAYFTYATDSYVVRRLNVSVGAALLSLSIAKELFVNRPRRSFSLALLLSAVFCAFSSFWLFRALSPLFLPVETPFASSSISVAMYSLTLAASMCWTLGFILLVSQRLGSKLREERENLRLIFESTPEAMLITRFVDGTIVDVNEGFLSLMGFSREELMGKSTIGTNMWNNPLDRQNFTDLLRDEGRCGNFESVFRKKDGTTFDGIISAKTIAYDGAPHIIAAMKDISERVRAERQIVQLARQLEIEKTTALRSANTDGLTGLANRRFFDETLSKEFYRAKRSGGHVGLIMLDVDFFKKFNDAFGHLAGDDCLRRIAGVLSSSVKRASDLPARYGGEEFAVIVPETDLDGAARFAELLRASVEDLGIVHPATEGGSVTISLGVASVRVELLEAPSSLIKLADDALYEAKRGGRNRVARASAESFDSAAALKTADTLCLYWSSKNQCGDRTIDTQHRRLFDDVNAVLSCLPAEASDPSFSTAIDRLVADVSIHFRDEEAILGRSGFPEASAHASLHAELESKAADLIQEFRRENAGLDHVISFLMYDLVVQHMLVEDKKFFPFVGDGAEPGALP